jgi:hypothetical protein
MQTFPWLMATYIPLTVLYVAIVWRVTALLSRSTFADTPWLITLVTLVAAALSGGIGTLAGEIYAILIEVIRVGDGHLGDRTAFIPYIQHEFATFIVGVLLFMAASLIRLRSGLRGPSEYPEA